MSKRTLSEVLPENLAGHQAVRAWHRLHPEQPEPERIEVLALKHKTAVYRLWGVGQDGGVVVAKRCRAETGGVERLVYEELLPAAGVPALRGFGLVPEPAGEFCWLFLEDAGAEAYSPANLEHRALAARFLATLHQMKLSEASRAALPDRSPSHYLKLIRSAHAVLLAHVGNPILAADKWELLQRLVVQYDRMLERWEELERFFDDWPRALVHDDFVIKNLRLRSGVSGPELLVFDWEMAGWGVPAVDLAQSIGKTASPDLEAYASARRPSDLRVTPERLARLAAYGNLLRLADKVYWETLGMHGPTYAYFSRPITTLAGYEPQLASALHAVDWTAHD